MDDRPKRWPWVRLYLIPMQWILDILPKEETKKENNHNIKDLLVVSHLTLILFGDHKTWNVAKYLVYIKPS
jgi:hypothetical protein